MDKSGIIQLALENMEKALPAKGIWRSSAAKGDTIDGKLDFKLRGQGQTFYVVVKKEVRNMALTGLATLAAANSPLMVVGYTLNTAIKDALRKQGIAYLEGNGNMYLDYGGTFIWIDGNKPIAIGKETGNRAFTKTGLKVLFHFLANEGSLNAPYRQLAEITGTSPANITNVMNGLKEQGYWLQMNKKEARLNHKKELFEKWVGMYAERLKPALLVGRFRFVRQDDFNNWKSLPLEKGKTYWGGEPGGSLLTGHLKPGMLALYTEESRASLMKNYRLAPDDKGNVIVFKKFWHTGGEETIIAPAALVYADLVDAGDRRCMETANKIYDEYLQNQF